MKPIEFISRGTLDQLLDGQVRKELQIIIGNATTGKPLEIPGGPLTELDRQAWENAIAKLTHTYDHVPKPGIPSPSFLDRMRILTIQEVADMFGLDLLGLIQSIENRPKAIPTLAIGDWVAFDRNSFAQWYVSQLHTNQ
ncbi:hypothetical protein [Pleomorphochaeta sp. DL1XJH-081]|jgi:hypothetical protein|uniref:hypothetical protein n=1 Tax=Pleomorphochaeta sp. DL1XJH-081 TaxID=3409690 RepID=UPI003BB7E6C9